MNRDPQMLMSIQIACIGIVIVVGFFYLWRMLSRIENKVDGLSCQIVNNCACMLQKLPGGGVGPSCKPVPVSAPGPAASALKASPIARKDESSEDEDEEEEDEDNEEDDLCIMKACLGDIPIQSLMDEKSASFMIFNTLPNPENRSGKEGVILEEIEEKKIEQKPEKDEKADTKQTDEVASVADTDSHDLSRSKLKKMNLDALKEICQSRGLSTDGVKNVLIDRIVASVPA